MRGPKRTYRPRFRAKELEEARAVFGRRKSPQGRARRAHLAILLAEKPDIPHQQAARIVGVCKNTVRNWRKRWAEEGFQLDDKPRPGRAAFFPSADRHIDQEHRV